MTHREKAEEHAAKARAVFEEAKAPVEPYVEAMLAIYELLLEEAETNDLNRNFPLRLQATT